MPSAEEAAVEVDVRLHRRRLLGKLDEDAHLVGVRVRVRIRVRVRVRIRVRIRRCAPGRVAGGGW